MAQFRGIGDTATQVKLQQDQQAASAAAAAASRAQQDSQFKQSMAQRGEQFDQTMQMQQENTAWTRSNTEQKQAEEARRFNIGQQALGRQEARQERQLDLQQFGAELDALRTMGQMDTQDTQRKLANAQLQQYIAATKEEQAARDNRERIAKGSFGSMVIAAKLNGGVIPVKALEIGNRELGDPNTQIVGGGFDEDTGLAWFDMVNKQDGTSKRLRMTPENQYAAIRAGIGEKEADMFSETFKLGSSARYAIDRQRIALQESIAVDQAKQMNRRALDANDPMKKAEDLLKKAETFNKLASDMGNTSISPEQRDEYRLMASDFAKEAARLQKGTIPQEQKAKPFAIPPDAQSKYGIPPEGQGSKVTPTPDGGYTVSWKDKGQMKVLKFAPGEW